MSLPLLFNASTASGSAMVGQAGSGVQYAGGAVDAGHGPTRQVEFHGHGCFVSEACAVPAANHVHLGAAGEAILVLGVAGVALYGTARRTWPLGPHGYL